MKVDAGYARHRQHHGVRNEESGDLGLSRLVGSGIRQRVKVVDVEFIRAPGSVGVVPVRDEAAVRLRALNQGNYLSLTQNAARGVDPNSVVGGQEVEKSHGLRWQRQ